MSQLELQRIIDTYNLQPSEVVAKDSVAALARANTLVRFQETCANIAAAPCLKDHTGKRCFKCRPFVVACTLSKKPIERVFATFSPEPEGLQ